MLSPARQVIDHLELDMREQLGNLNRLLARPRCKPRLAYLQAFSGAECAERCNHDFGHSYV
jgi:hypothetical protein